MTEYGVPGYSIPEHKCSVWYNAELKRWFVYCIDCSWSGGGILAKFALWCDAISLAMMHLRIQWCSCGDDYGDGCLIHG